MSVLAFDPMEAPHPWRALRGLAKVYVHWRSDMPDYLRGATDGKHIWMRSDMHQVERRCVLAHELEHIRRGHSTTQPPSVEAAVEHHAARWLLPDIRVVADALVWAAGEEHEAADVLWVTPKALRARLDPKHLHPAEKAVIADRFAQLESWA